jgi:lipopolysaccharide transport system ATP-binding protein
MCAYAIQGSGVSKSYQLGTQKSYSVKRDLQILADRFLKNKKEEKVHEFWTLRDVDFTIEQGEVVAFIGNNGAGKSTLLKILSNVIAPTTGIIEGKGSIASLLEVGTGFHPELTGRENVYLNGHLLGMNKAAIDKQFDAIVDFAGIDTFIDTPVKKYSSGMYVRLAFAIAAHVDPDILIIDEVLAVGDTAFQQKCMERIKKITSESGRTVILVSHNMTVIEQLCKTVFWLERGKLIESGNAPDIVSKYLSISHDIVTHKIFTNESEAPGNAYLRLMQIAVKTTQSQEKLFNNQPIAIQGSVRRISAIQQELRFRFILLDAKWNCLIDRYTALVTPQAQHFDIQIELPPNLFHPGFYYVYISALTADGTLITDFERVIEYYLSIPEKDVNIANPVTWGLINPLFSFDIKPSVR